jgi:rhodanese-related sulfurtransferase
MNEISPQKALELIQSNQVVLVDVREPDEFKQEHIAYAISVPLSQLERVFTEGEFEGRTVLFQCKKGMRGQKACAYVAGNKQLNVEVLNVEGGIDGWKEAGLTTISNNPAPAGFPIMRQVQITVGLLIVLFIILGYSGVSVGFVLAGMFGAALAFSGITGWCGLAIVLNKMPWNK